MKKKLIIQQKTEQLPDLPLQAEELLAHKMFEIIGGKVPKGCVFCSFSCEVACSSGCVVCTGCTSSLSSLF